jgi:hypothetical protein
MTVNFDGVDFGALGPNRLNRGRNVQLVVCLRVARSPRVWNASSRSADEVFREADQP